jgi:hypothetical protein
VTTPLRAQPPVAERVSVVVKATVLDAGYLPVMLPHMLSQAHFPFAERTVVVDPRIEFTAKYRDRPRSTRAQLDRVLRRLEDERVIDRVIEVPSDPKLIEDVMRAYFGENASHVPTHSALGCPILATLFGLQRAVTDRIVQMDADMFFHAADVSWVHEGLSVLEDPSVWLVMTHAGPPCGPVGTRASLGPANEHAPEWDERAKGWRFQSASTRYFLTDRRRLHGKVPVVRDGAAMRPLEDCLSAGLCREGAFRVNLAREGSWDLHVFDHGPPFLQWAAHIAWLIERGIVPSEQRGNYDLRLDQPPWRRAWRPLILDASRQKAVAPGPGATGHGRTGGSMGQGGAA